VKQMAVFNRKPVAYYVLAGIRHVLNHRAECQTWPKEYFFFPDSSQKQEGSSRGNPPVADGAEMRKNRNFPVRSRGWGGTTTVIKSLARNRINARRNSGP
jgi:hypothetical protein